MLPGRVIESASARSARRISIPSSGRLAIEAFGDLGAAQIVYLAGVHAFVSTVLNGFDLPAPQSDQLRLPAPR